MRVGGFYAFFFLVWQGILRFYVKQVFDLLGYFLDLENKGRLYLEKIVLGFLPYEKILDNVGSTLLG
jgi:hypothetical protein